MIYRLSDHGIVPDAAYPQTEEIQKILDLCRNGGGTVVFPKGTYRIASLLLHSDIALVLESGAVLLGSAECDDYAVYDVPEGVELRKVIRFSTAATSCTSWTRARTLR